eukprot:gene20506-22524_t
MANSIKKLLANDYSITRPNITGGPLKLEVSLHFVKLDGINTKKQSYESDVYLGMFWKDTRLCYNETEDIIISGDPHQNIWRPDLYFENALETDRSEITKYNHYIRIQRDGSIYGSIRASVVGKCPQSVMYFPFDSQHCEMVIESYGYPKNHLNLKWHQPSVTIQNRNLQQFRISQIRLETGQGKYISDRHLGYYIIQIYAPLHLVVMLSWLSFWMSPEDVGDRIGLGITCLLTLVFLMTSINESLPKVSYAKTIDFYLIGCFIYVLSVVIETVIAKQYTRGGEKEDEKVDGKRRERQGSGIYTCTICCSGKSEITTIQNPTAMMPNVEILGQDDNHSISTINTAKMELDSDNAIGKKEIATQQQESAIHRLTPGKRLDRYSRVIYPALFLLLNLLYFIICVRNGRHVD